MRFLASDAHSIIHIYIYIYIHINAACSGQRCGIVADWVDDACDELKCCNAGGVHAALCEGVGMTVRACTARFLPWSVVGASTVSVEEQVKAPAIQGAVPEVVGPRCRGMTRASYLSCHATQGLGWCVSLTWPVQLAHRVRPTADESSELAAAGLELAADTLGTGAKVHGAAKLCCG